MTEQELREIEDKAKDGFQPDRKETLALCAALREAWAKIDTLKKECQRCPNNA